MALKLTVLSIYALTIIVFGLIGASKTRSFSDFLLGGGKVGPWMSAFSYGTAYFSAVIFIGFAGNVGWNFGYSGIWVGFFNAIVGVFLVWKLLAWKVKQASLKYGVYTMSEFLEARYDAKYFKLLASFVIFIFLIPYSAAVFQGLSYLFESSLPGLQYWHAVLFMGFFTALYLSMGGYKSMASLDTFFGIIMVVGVILMTVFTISRADGLGNITAELNEFNPKLTAVVGPPGWWPLFSLVFLTSVAPFAMPQLIQKFLSIRDEKAIKIGTIASTVFALLIGCVAYFVGSTGRFFINAENTPGVFENGKPLFDRLMPELLMNIIPDSIFVIILVLLLSASMSTLAALVLISSSTLSKDFYQGYINKNVSDEKLTLITRVASVVFVSLSVALALFRIDTIVAILGISWGAIGSAFLGPFIWGILGNKANKYGAYASFFAGLGTSLVLYFNSMPSPQAGTIGMLVSLAVNPTVSIVFKQKGVKHEEKSD